ncbi:MAG: NAD(P)/FAD-dependent oxidoreductase [Clostridiaceae bacterium]
METKRRILIAGGGAAGMIAAISARRLGADVTIIEKNARVGKKILTTGNGRCNFTNINADISYYHGNNPGFAHGVLTNFTIDDTIRFFEDLGIEHKVEELGKVFPMSDQASSILDVLLYEMIRIGVRIICDACVKEITKEKGEFVIKLENGSTYRGDRVILAAGGKAMPSTGSDGSGYELAAMLGHHVTDVFPALVQLMLEGSFFKQIDGVKIVGTAEILYNGKSVVKDRGDILFANYGVSGPPILHISRKAGEFLLEGKEVFLRIVMMDQMTRDELGNILERRFRNDPGKPADFSLVGFVNKRLIPVVLAEAGIKDAKRPVAGLSPKDREAIVNVLTDWRFRIRGTKSWPSAQVTAGGVDTDEIDQDTMESLLVEGLYFAGEIVDIDGQCGGFNLQWAWSSGYVAGRCAAI